MKATSNIIDIQQATRKAAPIDGKRRKATIAPSTKNYHGTTLPSNLKRQSEYR